ncbi:MAG: sulfite exporter TauE/SafE family protein [Sporolactobacillus sp.]|jgi:uncharacterized membrane protein YfcA|nr:sulfite exporter TauE/SafE family protein [Sporolactobacillus sp.]MCI1880565.1 sulfite exporter TauE/SafE family protein [Sporolactobacillus sp.]
MLITLTMFGVGLLLGFVGAGGSGFIISILTTIFRFSIHTALGTSLTAMIFSAVSGSVSHYREGNMVLRAGIPVGIFGGAGAWFGSKWSSAIPVDHLKWMTAGMLLLSAVLLWLRMWIVAHSKGKIKQDTLPTGFRFWLSVGTVGTASGILSGLFGIGSTPFIQIGLMFLLNLSIIKAAGTTMLVIVPIALSGGIDNYFLGFLDVPLLLEVVIGTMTGSYIGAKFTRRLSVRVLKTAMLIVPILGATLLLV